jgi:hypothetical protein
LDKDLQIKALLSSGGIKNGGIRSRRSRSRGNGICGVVFIFLPLVVFVSLIPFFVLVIFKARTRWRRDYHNGIGRIH